MRPYIAVAVGSLVLAAPAFADDVIPPVVGGRTWVQHQIVVAKARHPEILSIVVEGAREGKADVVVLGDTTAAAHVFKPNAHPMLSDSGEERIGKTLVVRRPFRGIGDRRLGTMTIAFAQTVALTRARTIAAEVGATLAKHTLSAKNAADPWPYDASFSPNTRAQQLVDRITAKYPELLVMAIHATPPGRKTNVIIGSNMGRIGKQADEDDLRVIDKGTTNLEVADTKDRFETELPLNDAGGKRIGALGLVFAFHDGADREAIHAHGRAIRDELARLIPSSASLFAPAH